MSDQTFRDREILQAAHEKGVGATLGAFFRLSGPGWLQSAITLGGGSLGSALYLGMIGGTDLLWVQLVAIVIGVIMLSAISYVTLSSGKRPYGAINQYINPVLGVAWVTATILANMIFILPQFSLCYDALDQNLIPGGLGDGQQEQLIVSGIIAAVALVIVLMSYKPGTAAKVFDILLKLIVGFVVLCFVGAVVVLFQNGQVDWSMIGAGLIPTADSWNSLSGSLSPLAEGLDSGEYWTGQINSARQTSVIAAAAAAVGINMTFLLPYSMLARGWDRTFRGLARWDLITGMAIPFILVTSCIVLSSASAFHGKADENILSDDPAVVQKSPFFEGLSKPVAKRIGSEDMVESAVAKELVVVNAMKTDATKPSVKAEQDAAKKTAFNSLVAGYIAQMPENERKLALATVKPNSRLLALSLKPLLGDRSDLVFGLGALAMGFSTIVVLSLINGYALAEIGGVYESRAVRSLGAVLAMAAGISWVWLWAGASKTYLLIVAGTFAVVLLPIAYLAFFLMMNSKALLGDDKPKGLSMVIWNVLMIIGVAGAVAAAYVSLRGKLAGGSDLNDGLILGGVITFLLLMLIGFSARNRAADNLE